ncbi:NifB/NifX family molybdenum-iron cluster-binding protein [Sulfurovum mangrovi]|uniref:NifB/NifX family molybdenum-iron cluster-binding protein n=1 Tax=Sulfurovum mangrovi TaxID=2893889 RepID=UPI001E415BF6|nr:hypothetical protein [Sulfurovum mangrovi]UFH58424.1 hypothetical protein LN246_08685 [Sulfurovum mangrovi]
MRVVIPVKNRTDVFHDNMFKAPLFAVYTIDHIEPNVYCTCIDIINNPYSSPDDISPEHFENHGICDPESCTMEHITEHYILSHRMKSCDYVLADHFCANMTKALQEKGVAIYKISPFLHSPDIAIKNFILGVSLASKLQHIHFRT